MANETLAPLDSLSPVTGAVLGSVMPTPRAGIERAVVGALAVQRLWAQLRLRDRARYMARAAQAVIAEMDELAELLCLEQGHPGPRRC